MINTAAVTEAIRAQLAAHVRMEPFKQITRASYMNTDPGQCPWVGVYCSNVVINNYTLGRGPNTWKATLTLRIVVEAFSAESSEASEDELGDALDRTLDAILSDTKFGNAVDAVMGYEVEFSYKEDASETLEFRWAIITLKAEVRPA